MTFNPVTPADTDAVPCRRNPEKMFPTGTGRVREAQDAAAKNVCRTGDDGRPCPVLDRCLRYSLRHAVVGIWAATTEEERQAIRDRTGVVPLPLIVSTQTMRIYNRRAS